MIRGPYGPYKISTRAPIYRYNLGGFEGVQAVLAMVWPWLGSIKREQASAVLQAYRMAWEPKGQGKGQRSKTHCKAGHPYAGANLITKTNPDGSVRQRICRTCRDAYSKEYQKTYQRKDRRKT